MSPITQEAKDRIIRYLQDHTVPHDLQLAPERRPNLVIRMLISNLITAVRAERPEDNPF